MSKSNFFQPPQYNSYGREQLWIDVFTLSHDTWCGCNHPLAHLIDRVLPPGHKDRDLTISEILSRDLASTCHFGGGAETSGGPATDLNTEEDPTNEELEKLFSEDAINELLDAAARDEGPR